MKCWRILYVPDNTAFMIWAESKEAALNNARERNRKELGAKDCVDDYEIDEFTPETNEVGILVFYYIYTTFEQTQDRDKFEQERKAIMKCWRILYVPDNTAFMVWAESKEAALNKARERNRKELGAKDCVDDYKIDEFTPETNTVGIIVFYDIYTTFERIQDKDNMRSITLSGI